MILLTVFALESCGNSKATATNMQENIDVKQTETLSGKYTITLLSGKTELPENMHLTFDATENRVSGFAGCNNFSGEYSTDGETIKIGPLVSTKMACKRFMDVENHTFKVLEQVSMFSVKDGKMQLGDKQSLLIEGRKGMASRIEQGDDYTIEYVSQTRGSYKMIAIENNVLKYQKERDSNSVSRTCSSEEIEAISKKMIELDLEKLTKLEAPSQKRFHDGAAAATIKVTYKGETYETPAFDDGSPNEYIADLVNSISKMVEKQ